MVVCQRKKRKWLTGLVIAALVVLFLAFALSGSNGVLLKKYLAKEIAMEDVREHLSALGLHGMGTLTVLAALQVICTFLPAEPVQMLAGFTFGFPRGLACCMVGVLLGSTTIYLLQSMFGDQMRGYFVKKLNLDLEKIAHSNRATVIIFLLYFLPAIPYGMISFFAASIGMRYRRFLLVTTLGSLPSVCIGVGLGYMTNVSNWVLTVCVFAVLIMLVLVGLRRKEKLFAWLNNYADGHKPASPNRVKKVNPWVLNPLYFAVRAYLFLHGVRVKAVNKIGKPEGPAMVLCNHGSFIDFAFATVLLRKYKPHFVSARLYFYDKRLAELLRNLGAFPKSMFAADMENARNCFAVLRQKELLVLMPEARLSTSGRFEDIQENTYSFIKTAGVNVYTLKLGGDYLADPKWGKGFRRGAVVEAELDLLYTADQVKEISLDEIKQGVVNRLDYDEFKWLEQRPQQHYHSKRMAEGLENILTTCPLCGGKYTLTTQKNQVACQNCGHLTSMDNRYGFDSNFRFKHLGEWYDWQKAQLQAEIVGNDAYALTSRVALRLPSTGKGLTRPGGEGVCTLNRQGLTYAGTKDGETVELHFPIERVYRLLFGAGQNFEIYDGPEILFFVPEEKRSAVEWYMASAILHDMAAQATH